MVVRVAAREVAAVVGGVPVGPRRWRAVSRRLASREENGPRPRPAAKLRRFERIHFRCRIPARSQIFNGIWAASPPIWSGSIHCPRPVFGAGAIHRTRTGPKSTRRSIASQRERDARAGVFRGDGHRFRVPCLTTGHPRGVLLRTDGPLHWNVCWCAGRTCRSFGGSYFQARRSRGIASGRSCPIWPWKCFPRVTRRRRWMGRLPTISGPARRGCGSSIRRRGRRRCSNPPQHRPFRSGYPSTRTVSSRAMQDSQDAPRQSRNFSAIEPTSTARTADLPAVPARSSLKEGNPHLTGVNGILCSVTNRQQSWQAIPVRARERIGATGFSFV